MSLRFYYDLMSQPARAVLLFLKCANVPFTGVLTDLRKGAQLTEEYKKIHPFQRVPAIDDSGFTVMESVTIMKYLAEKYKVPDHWYPSDLQRKTRVDEFLSYYHTNLRINAAFFFRVQVIDPRRTGKPVDEKAKERFRRGLEVSLREIETYFLANDSNYLCGQDEISIADLIAICELMQPRICGFDLSAGRPRLSTWMERVISDTQPHFDEAHKITEMVRKRFLSAKL